MVNEPLLRECISVIEADEEGWDQRHWEEFTDCGTTRCLAGWAVYLHIGGNDVYEYCLSIDSSVSEVAQELLGFTDDQASELFRGDSATDKERSGLGRLEREEVNDLNLFKKRITEMTGVEFKSEEDGDADDVG